MQFNPRTLKIAGIAVGAILVILLALPMFINVGKFRPKIEAALTESLGRQVTLGKLSLSIFGGSVGVSDVRIADDPSFSSSPFVTVKTLNVGVKLMPLIFSKELKITSIVLDAPQITLLSAPNGKWNFSSLGGPASAKPTAPQGAEAPPALSVEDLEIKDGKLILGSRNSSKSPAIFDNLAVEVKNFSATTEFPLNVSVDLPGGGNAGIEGKAGPMNSLDAAKTPFNATMEVKNLDIAKSRFVDASSGMGGIASLDGTLTSDGSQARAQGNVNLEKMKFSPKGSPAPKEISAKYAVTVDLGRNTGSITQGDISVGKAQAKLTGGFQSQGEAMLMNLKLSAPGMSVDELESFLPALGVTLPSGAKLTGGALSADLTISGSLDRLVISGPVQLSNAKLAGFSMGSKLGALSAFSGRAPSGSDTIIQNASLNARIAPEMTSCDAINLTVPSLGNVTGAGTISPAGALDFKMMANLETQRSEARMDKRGGVGGGIGFKIQGTASNPSFVPDAGSIATEVAKGALQKSAGDVGSKSGITGFLKKR
jgi:AsmA protein